MLKLANNSETRVIGKGDVHMAIADNPNGVITLKNTLYVPNLRLNLMSNAKIVNHGHEITFQKSCAFVTHQSGITMRSALEIYSTYANASNARTPSRIVRNSRPMLKCGTPAWGTSTHVTCRMRTQSSGGARYYITFIDNYSRVCLIYFLKNKGDSVRYGSSIKKWRIYSRPQVSDSVLRQLTSRNRTAWPSERTAKLYRYV